MRWGDERAVTVQIGAVLLLAILFTALALYQVNAVPAENEVVEIEHNDEVHNEMQDLRNAIQNVGTSGESRSISVTLGTQYPHRTFASNPPNPRGTLETSEPEPIRIEDVEPVGSYDGPVSELFNEDLETRSIMYEPGYNEYTQAPVTRIEHGFAFNDFDGTGVGLTSQPVVDGTDITIIQVDGDLSESSSGAVSVDARLGSGPTDPIKIRPEGDDGVVEIPTQTPDAWNESIDESTVTIDSYSGGILSIELEEDEEYELRMACVVVGHGTGDSCGNFNITEEMRNLTGKGNASVLPGPEVTDLKLSPEEGDITDEDSITVESNISTLDDQGSRSGLPLKSAEWNLERLDETYSDSGKFEEVNPREKLEVFQEVDDEIGELDAGDYILSIRAQDTRGIWNETDDGETKTFTVVGTNGVTEMADRTEYVEGSGEDADNNGRIEFDLENTGIEDSVEITALTVDDTTDNNADIVDNDGNREFEGADGFVNLPGEIEIGDTEPTELNETAGIDADTTETFSLEEFRDSGNNNNRNHNGDNITVTLIFSDGSELTFTTEDL